MIDKGRHNILGVMINAVDYEAAVQKIVDASRSQTPLGVSALAVHGLMTGALDREHRYRLNRLGLIVPDGQPVRWALNRLYGTSLTDRVYGPTLMLKTCERAAKEGLSIFLLGADQEMLDRLRASLIERYPDLKIAGYRPSRFRQLTPEEKTELINEVRESNADILFVGLGCPRQEIFCYEYCSELEMPALAVGAAFAFHAGCLPQAPPWMQRWGLEWLFRFAQEPKRLWKRYMYLNPLYVTLVTLQMLKLRCPTEEDVCEPTVEYLYG